MMNRTTAQAYQSLAACLAVTGVLLLLPVAAGAEELELIASEPVVLVHPHINKSIGNPVHCLAFVRDGEFLATGAASGVLIWDVPTGQLKHTLAVDERAVDSLALHPDGSLLAAGGASGGIKIFDVRSFQTVRTLGPAPGAVRAMAFSPDGKLLATVSPNGQEEIGDEPFGVLLWKVATGELVRKIPLPTPDLGAVSLTFLPAGNQLLTAQDRTIRVIDLEQGDTVQTIERPDLPRTIGSLALSPDGRWLATGSLEPRVRLWDTQSWQQRTFDAHTEEPPPRSGLASIGLSPDGRFVLTGGMDCKACVWDAATGRRLLQLDARGDVSSRWITGVAMSPDNRLFAASHFGGTASLWRISAGK
ncbi:WD40 repeat domain-containing protein [Lignipirellula cremea]|uniref:WD domain, G-beta repeat n=1 Tax=Lignipirellula cremea TaxID=2528010 RepID=A0A518DW07_9BACT|nr:WD40 repeat domain-containing protein [Lignipirellula cremea]QDU96017.1 WD domain, G-beta repeat [Lignipirellula cremea]